MWELLPYIMAALLCVAIYLLVRKPRGYRLRAQALAYVAEMHGTNVVHLPTPSELGMGLRDAGSRLAQRARFLAVRMRAAKENDDLSADVLEDAEGILIGFLHGMQGDRRFEDAAVMLRDVLEHARTAREDKEYPIQLRQDIYAWVTDAEQWMRVVEYVYTHVIITD